MKTWLVYLTDGSTRTVKADYFEMDGELTFYRTTMDALAGKEQVAAFNTTTWTRVEVSEPA